jgi:hypothetical protein
LLLQGEVLEALQSAIAQAKAGYPSSLEQDMLELQQPDLPWWVLGQPC